MTTQNERRFSLRLTTIIFGLCFSSSVSAVGFGEATLRSGLGQALNVQVPVTGIPQEDLTANCIKANVTTIDGAYIANPRMEFVYPHHADQVGGNGNAVINLISKESIQEPAINLSIALTCDSTIERNYSLLLDYAEISAPVLANTAVGDADSNRLISTPIETDLMQGVAAPVKKVPQAQAASTAKKAAKRQANNTIQPAAAKVTTPNKDQLKVSNEEALPVANTKSVTPVSDQKPVAEKPAEQKNLTEQKPIDVEQQRIQENSHAQQQFSAMMRDESTLYALQEANLKREQQKVRKLELELEQLKLQVQTQNKQDQALSTTLMVVNAIALLVILGLLLVGRKLWMALRKTRQQQDDSQWNAPSINKHSGTVSGEPQVGDVKKHARPTTLTSEIQVRREDVRQDQTSHSGTPKESKENKELVSEGPSDATAPRAMKDKAPNVAAARNTPQSIQIEELSDYTQEAEFWVSINNPKRAIEILEPQSYDEELSIPVTLFYLLDLYRMTADKEKYTKLSARLKNKFNARIPEFDEVVDPTKSKSLEDHEFVASRCCSLWSTEQILPYLESLILDDREGERIGFELSVYRDILFLIAIRKELERKKNVPVSSS